MQGHAMRNYLHKAREHLHAIQDRLSVQAQIIAAITTTVIVLVGALAAGAAFVSYRNTAALVSTRLASVASTTAERLDRFIAVRQQEMRLFSQLEAIGSLGQSDPAVLRRALEHLQSSFTDFAWIGFARPDGTVAAATGGLLQGRSV